MSSIYQCRQAGVSSHRGPAAAYERGASASLNLFAIGLCQRQARRLVSRDLEGHRSNDESAEAAALVEPERPLE